MYKNKTIVAFIPARGGSKGIPNKNMYPLNGHPLIYYTVLSAQKAPYIDEIIVSTDSSEIAEYCTSLGCTVIHRPPELATDTSPTIDAVMHMINTCHQQNKKWDYLCLLQATSPLRKSFHIQEIIEQAVDKNQEGIVSVHRVKNHPILMRFSDGGMKLKNVLNMSSTVRRQDMPPVYYVNGSIWLCKTNILTPNISLNDLPFGYEMDEKYCVDINNLSDMHICKSLLED